MLVGVLRESEPGECRVGATPNTIKKLQKLGFSVLVETGAGDAATMLDDDYRQVGAQIADSAAEVWASADVVVKVNPPTADEIAQLRPESLLISMFFPAQNKELTDQIAARGGSVLALDQIPRISRAQKLDVLSSMANIAGYRAVIEAAHALGGFFGGQITAAGRTDPAKVLVIGAGVAGLASLATARSLGAIVRGFDVRPATREQIESLGGEFLEVDIEEEGETLFGR